MTADDTAALGEETLAQRDKRLFKWLAKVRPGDIVTVRLNSTDTLTGKVYEAPDARGMSLCVNTTVLRHGNGYPGGSYELVGSGDAMAAAERVRGYVEARDLFYGREALDDDVLDTTHGATAGTAEGPDLLYSDLRILARARLDAP